MEKLDIKPEELDAETDELDNVADELSVDELDTAADVGEDGGAELG